MNIRIVILRILTTIGVAVFLGIVATWAGHNYLHDSWWGYLLLDGYAIGQTFMWFYKVFPYFMREDDHE